MSLDLTSINSDADLNTPDSVPAHTSAIPMDTPAAAVSDHGAFDALGLSPDIVKSITRAGYDQPTEVQARAVPPALTGADLLVSSQTGSGKTAAFVWPALQRIMDARNDPAKRRAKGAPSGPRVLVLAPTRELAMQVSRACTTYGSAVQGLRVAHVVGGVPYHAQLKALRGPLDLLIATPGRLLDLMNSGAAIMGQVEMLVLDEADRMLDMGFIDDITTIAKSLPEPHQTLMFSATFAGNVGQLAQTLTNAPQRIAVDSHTDTHAQISQRLHWADSLTHKHALLEQLLTDRDMDQCLVFTSTQQDADALSWKLGEIGHAVAALHGGMPQGRRNRVLQGLRQRQVRVLVATDVAARGIDVPTITHVINWGLPMKAEDYVHRIGRTGRAGRDGVAITLAERRDVGLIRRIERFTTQPIAVSVVPGLEPKLPAPSNQPFNAGPRRPGSFGGGRPGGKPSFGRGRPEGGGFGGGGSSFGGGRPEFRGENRSEPRGDAPHGGPRGGQNGGYQGGYQGAPRGEGGQGGHHGGGGFGGAHQGPQGQGARGNGPSWGDRGDRGERPSNGPSNGPRTGGFRAGNGGPARRGGPR